MEEYQSVHEPEDQIEAISEANSSDNKIQAIHFNNNQAIVQNDHSNNHNKNGHIHINHTNNPEDESHDELNSSPQLYGMEPNKIVDQEYKILLPVRPSKSTSISVKHNGTTNTSTSLHALFLMCLYETAITILCLHMSLTIYLNLRLYKVNSYNHLYSHLQEMEVYGYLYLRLYHLYLYLRGMEFYSHFYLQLYTVILYVHIQ